MGERVEVRRLMAWFNEKFFEAASDPLVTERIYKRFMGEKNGGGAPATDVIRAAKANVRYHLAYIGWLAQTGTVLAGDNLTYADLAAAAHLSAIDYLGDVPWVENAVAKAMVPRVKSRPSFRPWLANGCGHGAVAHLRRSRLLPRDDNALPTGDCRQGSSDRLAALGCDSSALPIRLTGGCRPALPPLPRRGPPRRHGLARGPPSAAAIPRAVAASARTAIMLAQITARISIRSRSWGNGRGASSPSMRWAATTMT